MEKPLEEYEKLILEAFDKLITNFKNYDNGLLNTEQFVFQVTNQFFLEYSTQREFISWKSYVHKCSTNHNLDSEEQFIFEEHKIVITLDHDFYKNIVRINICLEEDPCDERHPRYNIKRRSSFFYQKAGPLIFDDTQFVNKSGGIVGN